MNNDRYTLSLGDEYRYDRYAALDIETDGFDGSKNDLIAIGVGYHPVENSPEIDVMTRASVGGDELDIIRAAYDWINDRNPDGLITYNGVGFDFRFLDDKLRHLGADPTPHLSIDHLDLFPERKRNAEERNIKWPKLEECLEAYGIPVYDTEWEGRPFTGKLLAEEFAPLYLGAMADGDGAVLNELEDTLWRYTASDIEATIALYEADLDREYVPTYAY